MTEKTENGAEVMVSELKKKARLADVPMADALQAAGVDRSTLYRWEQNPPKSLVLYNEISKAIDELAAQKAASGS